MGRKPRRAIAVAQRRERVADLYLQGWTQTAIAGELGVAQSTICVDLQVVQAQWKESAIRDFNLAREIELKKIDRLEREAWAAWERSQQPSQSARVKGDGGKTTEKTLKNRYGDPRFLDQVNKCIAARRALLGLDDAPPLVETRVTVAMSDEERKRHIDAIVEEYRERHGFREDDQPADQTKLIEAECVRTVEPAESEEDG